MFDVSLLFGQFVGGLTTAMFLFLIASGLSLVFGVMRVLNFAHGSFYMVGAYLAWQAVAWLAPALHSFWLAALIAALGVALLGGLIERLLLRHIYGREELYQLLLTYALVLILGDAAKLIWGTQQLSVSRPAGPFRRLPAPRHHPAGLQFVHHADRRRDRGRRLARADAQPGGADGARRGARPRDAGRARRQCRRALYRHVRRELLPGGAVRRAGHADPEHRAGNGRRDHRRGASSSW